MENLNDAEFGSDKSAEEAPILIAQRYLNIYRQVHIFNKAKRDQFDDELLALPPQVTNFFKRMPGGRLLVEHIEEVKTERGIAFVKANKDDFAEGSGMGESSPQPMQMVGGAPIVGGSVTVDASFAEALANSMANAFKNNPMQATVSGGGTVNSTLDFGNTFDVIAEEIRTSRASLLDVLKETKSITDSVIASQVSISRILEGILSSRTKDNIGTADLNNRIIASQTSITKLLEGLYSANTQKNSEISDYLNIENRLQSFKSEMKAEIEQSLNKIQDMFSAYTKTLMSIQSKPVNIVVEQDFNNIDDVEDDTEASEQSSNPVETFNVVTSKKKKKKKKNKNNNSEQTLNSHTPLVVTPVISGVIRNEEFKHNDSFDNVDLNEPPLEFDNELKTNNDVLIDEFDNDFEDDFDDGLDFTLPEQGGSLEDNSNASKQVTESSLDDFTLNVAAENSIEEATNELESDDISLDDFTLDVVAENSIEEATNELESDDVSFDDFTLDVAAENSIDEATNELESDDISLDDFTFDAVTENSIEEATNGLESDDISLDDFTLNVAAESSIEEATNVLESDDISLDDFTLDVVAENSIEEATNELESDDVSLEDFTLDVVSENSIEEATNELEFDDISLDNQYSIAEGREDNNIINEPTHNTQSRYSAELDKIRAALTSDNVDLSSLDEPISLDDYNDDENIPSDNEDEEWEYEYVEDDSNDAREDSVVNVAASDEEWEYEYVDENGNPIEDNGEGDWEWEYVEEEVEEDNNDNKE